MKNIFTTSLIVSLLVVSLFFSNTFFNSNAIKNQVSERERKDSPDKFKEYFSSIKKGDELDLTELSIS